MDEISMVGYNMQVIIHLKLYKLKSNILPFGGMNIMFMGNFLQFPCITDTPLYQQISNQLLHLQKKNSKKLLVKVNAKIIFVLIA